MPFLVSESPGLVLLGNGPYALTLSSSTRRSKSTDEWKELGSGGGVRLLNAMQMGAVRVSWAKKNHSLAQCHHLFVGHSFSGRDLYGLPLNHILSYSECLERVHRGSFPIYIHKLSWLSVVLQIVARYQSSSLIPCPRVLFRHPTDSKYHRTSVLDVEDLYPHLWSSN